MIFIVSINLGKNKYLLDQIVESFNSDFFNVAY